MSLCPVDSSPIQVQLKYILRSTERQDIGWLERLGLIYDCYPLHHHVAYICSVAHLTYCLMQISGSKIVCSLKLERKPNNMRRLISTLAVNF